MSKIDDGRPAFPVSPNFFYPGMSLRDWFAGQALVGWLAHGPVVNGENICDKKEHAEMIAQACFRYADAMLAEGRKRGGE